MLSCEFCELFKNTYFLEDLQTASSETPVRGSFFNKVTSLTARLTFNSARKLLPHSHFSVNFDKFLGNRFCGTPPSNHFSHDMTLFFFLFVDQWGLQPKINLFLWKSGGNFIVKLRPHMYPFRHSNSWRSGSKARTEKLVNVGWILLSCHVRPWNFHVRENDK